MIDLETALADSFIVDISKSQRNATERVNHHDNLKVPENFQFNLISGLSNEMIERLNGQNRKLLAKFARFPGLLQQQFQLF